MRSEYHEGVEQNKEDIRTTTAVFYDVLFNTAHIVR